ncbi:MAG: CoA transferase [Gammaproteobacteria bacterium]|nr:CoA transferase [Gammaproteobacteria bacterium]
MDKQEFYAEADASSTGPLQGIRVLEATNYGAGPYCGTVLADFGAESIKCEMPVSGDPVRHMGPFVGGKPGLENSTWHLSIGRNKKSITLDFGKPEGQAVFRDLARKADILVENFTPGTMAKWGLGYRDISEIRPDIIYVSVSGFGQFGPLSNKRGFDPVAQAMGGLMSVTGEPDGRPLRAGFALADLMGGWTGAMGAMAALNHRHETGEGQHIDASLTDAILYGGDFGIAAAAHADYVWQRQGNSTDTGAPLNTFVCKDGQHVFVHAFFDNLWQRLCKTMGRDDLIDDPRTRDIAGRAKNRHFVDDVVAEWTGQHDAAEVLRLADEAGVVSGPILDFGQIAEFEPFLERESVAVAPHPQHGPIKTSGVGPKFSRTPARVRTAAPTLGQHSEEVYRELLGYDEDKLERLRAASII